MSGEVAKPQLKSVPMGKTGLMVSELCLGCMTFGTSDKNNWGLGTANFEDSMALMKEYRARGGYFFDTADVYGLGDSENVLGKFVEGTNRDDLVLATKVRGRFAKGANDAGLSRKHIMSSITSSLERLKTSYVDIYQVHSFDVQTPLEETLSTLNDLVRIGKVRYVGVSNFSGWHLQKALDISKQLGLEKFVVLQPQYNLLCRYTEWDLLPICEAEGLGVIPWSPLAGGWLSGRYSKDMKPEAGSRVAWAQKVGWKATNWDYHANERTWDVLTTVDTIAKKYQRSAAQVSLRWLMQKKGVTAPIIGAKTMQQLQDNLDASTLSLTEEDMKTLDQASHVEAPYPWGNEWNFVRT